ncbi:sialate O-acetylesterase [Parabacteroides sp. FAFU027]|uniref:sialate O-acetylesterase n=1 Tax=Parabacteroides sp. FAFU027 TaxID=2922715 RepID=UPI001FAECC66|nr:sialate O-acetylesterase [Parabacteroides sp. FAFU027]
MRPVFLLISFFALIVTGSAQNSTLENRLKENPSKVWVFILAGQSNMAGRGNVEAQDTVTTPRVLSMNDKGEIVPAREPLNFYEIKMQGTGCGLAFGKELLNSIPNDVSVLILQTAVGGSSINQWIKNSTHRDIQLFTNFKEKVELGKRYGTIKAILWHQGETDAKPEGIQQRQENLKTLFGMFRNAIGNDSLPILMGELGSYSKTPVLFAQMNEQTRLYSASDRLTSVITTADFQHRGDFLHFNSAGQREMGKRFAREYVCKFMTK